jgi:Protein of unknown function (DUF1275)
MTVHARRNGPLRMREAAAMALAAASGSTDAVGYLALGRVFTSAMTGNLTLLGIAVAHRDGLRIGRVTPAYQPIYDRSDTAALHAEDGL